MQNSLDCTNKIDQQGVGCQREGPGNECATSQPGTANRNDLPLVYTGAGNKSRLGGVVGLTRLTSSEANFSYLDYIANPLRNVKRCPGWVTLGSCENGIGGLRSYTAGVSGARIVGSPARTGGLADYCQKPGSYPLWATW